LVDLILQIKQQVPQYRAQFISLKSADEETTTIIDESNYSEVLRNLPTGNLEVCEGEATTFRNNRLNELKQSMIKVLDEDGWITGTGFMVSANLLMATGKLSLPFSIILENGDYRLVERTPETVHFYNRLLSLSLVSVNGYESSTWLTIRGHRIGKLEEEI
jgi:hypothetical protein